MSDEPGRGLGAAPGGCGRPQHSGVPVQPAVPGRPGQPVQVAGPGLVGVAGQGVPQCRRTPLVHAGPATVLIEVAGQPVPGHAARGRPLDRFERAARAAPAVRFVACRLPQQRGGQRPGATEPVRDVDHRAPVRLDIVRVAAGEFRQPGEQLPGQPGRIAGAEPGPRRGDVGVPVLRPHRRDDQVALGVEQVSHAPQHRRAVVGCRARPDRAPPAATRHAACGCMAASGRRRPPGARRARTAPISRPAWARASLAHSQLIAWPLRCRRARPAPRSGRRIPATAPGAGRGPCRRTPRSESPRWPWRWPGPRSARPADHAARE